MSKDKRYPWYIGELSVFIILNVLLFWLLRDRIVFDAFFVPWQFMIFGLAVYRGATIISDETITKPLRSPFVREEKKGIIKVEEPKKSGFKGSVGSLVYCPSCVGVWLASFIFYCYMFLPTLTMAFAIILALSSVERILTTLLSFFTTVKNE